MRDPGILDPRHFLKCQALFDNLSRFMCFLGTFLEKKTSQFMSLFWQNAAIYVLLGTFFGKSRDLRLYFGKMSRFMRFLGTFLGKML